MKVLITGADGYIGAVLGRLLQDHGHDVAGLDAGFFRNGTLWDDHRRLPMLTKDTRRVDAADVVDFDAVVHPAELADDPLGQHDNRLPSHINHRGSVELART